MKKTTTKFRRLVANGFIDVDDFYVISIKDNEIDLQGHFNSELIKKYSSFVFEVSRASYVEATRSNINITLT